MPPSLFSPSHPPLTPALTECYNMKLDILLLTARSSLKEMSAWSLWRGGTVPECRVGNGVWSKTLCLSETSNQDQLREKVRFVYSNVNPWEPPHLHLLAKTPHKALSGALVGLSLRQQIKYIGHAVVLKSYYQCCLSVWWKQTIFMHPTNKSCNIVFSLSGSEILWRGWWMHERNWTKRHSSTKTPLIWRKMNKQKLEFHIRLQPFSPTTDKWAAF